MERRLLEHLGCHVDTDDLAARTDLGRGDERVEPGAGADVDDSLTRRKWAQRERVADSGERLDRAVRQRVDRVRLVAEAGGERTAGVEVELALGHVGHLAVLLAHLVTQHFGIDEVLPAHSTCIRPGKRISSFLHVRRR